MEPDYYDYEDQQAVRNDPYDYDDSGYEDDEYKEDWYGGDDKPSSSTLERWEREDLGWDGGLED